jgi:hypothetical protein
MPLVFRIAFVFFIVQHPLPGFSQTKAPASSWKEFRWKKFYFKYPDNFSLEKQINAHNIIISVTPNEIKDFKGIPLFSINEIQPQGHSYADLRKDFVEANIENTGEEAKTIHKKDTTFKKLRAAYAELLLFSKSTIPLPVRIFAIDGGSRFYLVTIAELPEFKDIQAEMTQITNAMLISLTIEK